MLLSSSLDERSALYHGERVTTVTSNLDCWNTTIHVVDQYLPCDFGARVKRVEVS